MRAPELPSRRLLWVLTVLSTVGLGAAVVAYNRANPRNLALQNHLISELGVPQVSPLSYAFNGALLAAAILFHVSLRRVMPPPTRSSLAFALVLASIGSVGLFFDASNDGVLPLWFSVVHSSLAVLLFSMLALTIAIVTRVLVRRQQASLAVLSTALLFGLSATALAATSVDVIVRFRQLTGIHPEDPAVQALLESRISLADFAAFLDRHRPPVLWPALLEWLTTVLAALWLAAVSCNPHRLRS